MASVFIEGHILAAGHGLVVDAGFDDGVTEDKMIISIPSNTHAPIARLTVSYTHLTLPTKRIV